MCSEEMFYTEMEKEMLDRVLLDFTIAFARRTSCNYITSLHDMFHHLNEPKKKKNITNIFILTRSYHSHADDSTVIEFEWVTL